MSPLAFTIFAPLILLSALSVILWKNPIQSALSLVVTLALLAITYFQLDAPFVGILQLLVYAGAIMVLFVFVIMLINLHDDELETLRFTASKWTKVMAGTLFLTVFASVLWHARRSENLASEVSTDFGNMKAIALRLFDDYGIALELLSFLILLAAIGAIALARAHQPIDKTSERKPS